MFCLCYIRPGPALCINLAEPTLFSSLRQHHCSFRDGKFSGKWLMVSTDLQEIKVLLQAPLTLPRTSSLHPQLGLSSALWPAFCTTNKKMPDSWLFISTGPTSVDSTSYRWKYLKKLQKKVPISKALICPMLATMRSIYIIRWGISNLEMI